MPRRSSTPASPRTAHGDHAHPVAPCRHGGSHLRTHHTAAYNLRTGSAAPSYMHPHAHAPKHMCDGDTPQQSDAARHAQPGNQ